ncbi:MAG: elongation factor 4, partial [Cyclobacteriaceae bacterium]
VQERLEREFDMTVITTVPSVQFHAIKTDGSVLEVNAPSELPEGNMISHVEEPFILAQIISKSEFIGGIIALCMDKRGAIKNQVYLTSDRVELSFELPLSEIVFDFYDKLKTISRGYASLDYELIGFKQSNMVKLDIMLNGDKVDALSAIVHRDKAYEWGKRLCEKLRQLIPRQMFEVAVQAAIGTKIIARESVKAMRKNVLAKCYGGDITRKRKLLEKQKKGKKRMRQVGNVEIPQEAFMAVLKLD